MNTRITFLDHLGGKNSQVQGNVFTIQEQVRYLDVFCYKAFV